MYLIVHRDHPDLFWTDNGWGDLALAIHYNKEETEYTPPIGGVFILKETIHV